jgi:LCP family protein required for cell wall assembly
MRSRSPQGSFPSLIESVLALVLGVAIGLCVTRLDEHFHFFHQPEGRAQQLASVNADDTAVSASSSSSFSLVPTLDHRMNILVLGVDSNGKNTQRFLNTRSDTMMVVSVDPYPKKVSVVSIPRDSRVTIAAGHGDDKINAAHAYGGPDLAVQTVTENFGVPIDRYLVVDVQGLKRVCEIIGPVDILVEKKMTYADRAAGLNIALEPGRQSLGPTELEEYVRFRHDARGDISRIERQQWFLREVSKKFQDPQIILKLPELYQCASDFVVTNLTIDEMAKLAAFAKDLKLNQIETAVIPGVSTMIKGGSYWLPDYDGAALVFNRLAGANLTIPYRRPQDEEEHFGDEAGPNAVQAAELPEVAAPAETSTDLQVDRPLSVVLRYARGSEVDAKNLEMKLVSLGYRVTSRIRADLADCQHEQIIQTSAKPPVDAFDKLKEQVPEVAEFPEVINLDSTAPGDLAIVISPQTHFPEPSIANSQSDQTQSAMGHGI